MFTKQHYKAIAEVIKWENTELNSLNYLTGISFTEARNATKRIALSLAIIFADNDPRFDKDKFIEACRGE